MAKSVAYGGQHFQVNTERKRQQRQETTAKARKAAHYMEIVRIWLATDPEPDSRHAYDRWRKEYNRTRPEGTPKAVGEGALRNRWPGGWKKIVAAAKEHRLPGVLLEEKEVGEGFDGDILGEADLDEEGRVPAGDGPEGGGDAEALRRLQEQAVAVPADLRDDPALRARRLRALREARGWNMTELARKAGTARVLPRKLENGETPETKIRILISFATLFEVSLDYFATDDGGEGYTPTATEEAEQSSGSKEPRS
jgi:DNA-binding XRE family transcriptional regulator